MAERPEVRNIAIEDLAIIMSACADYIDLIDSTDYHEDRVSKAENFIFEKAMEAVFGEEVWTFINETIDAHDNGTYTSSESEEISVDEIEEQIHNAESQFDPQMDE